MGVEAYTVSYDRANYHAPIPDGYESADVFNGREREIRENLLRYLGEYRLGVKFDEFFYREGQDPLTHKTYLVSSEPGPVRNIFQKAIRVREEQGLSVRREVAECLGFEKLEKQLVGSSGNMLFVWVSPPGPKADGYGEYSFTFIGEVIKDESSKKKIRVVPYRNILSNDEHRAYLKYFINEANNFNSDVDFLSNPIVIARTDHISSPEDIISLIGEKEKFSKSWFQRLSKYIGSLIDRYIELVRNKASDFELSKVKFAMENYTLVIKNQVIGNDMTFANAPTVEENVNSAIELWGFTPPKVFGSCGLSFLTLMEYHEELNKKWEYHTGDCVICNTKNVDVGPCNICKSCEKKFDEQEGLEIAA